MSGTVLLILRILIAALLYGFLAWALITLWRDLRVQGQAISSPSVPPISLTSLENPAEQQVFFTPEVLVGRSSNCELCIPNDTVSVRHARLSYHHNQWWIEDVQSTNGTFLNDERVSVPTVIASGDELRFGQVGLMVVIDEKSR